MVLIGCEKGMKTEMALADIAINMVPFLKSNGTGAPPVKSG